MQEFDHYCIVGGMPAAVKADTMQETVQLSQEEIRQMLIKFLYC